MKNVEASGEQSCMQVALGNRGKHSTDSTAIPQRFGGAIRRRSRQLERGRGVVCSDFRHSSASWADLEYVSTTFHCPRTDTLLAAYLNTNILIPLTRNYMRTKLTEVHSGKNRRARRSIPCSPKGRKAAHLGASTRSSRSKENKRPVSRTDGKGARKEIAVQYVKLSVYE